MMTKLLVMLCLFIGITFMSCKEEKQKVDTSESNTFVVDSVIVYQTENLIIRRLSNHIYEHISYLNTQDFGKVACNGMLVVNDNKGVLFDTPTDNQSSLELMNFVSQELKSDIIAFIPTHFHKDCIGGIEVFEAQNIPLYATNQTIELLKEIGQEFSKPITNFDDRLTVDVGDKKVYAAYFGEGHTKDNIIGYFPEDKAVFGGCLIKKIGAGKGNLEDANTNEWPETVRKIKLRYPDAKIVIPGHGQWGGTALFDYTIKLFEKK